VRFEFVARPPRGRVYSATRRVHAGDVDGSARLRLAALAHFFQDVATDDVADAGVESRVGVWMMRRMEVEISEWPRFGNEISLDTFASGTGPRWAERRTTMRRAGALLAECAAVWVFVDPTRGRPLALPAEFDAVYGASARDRRVTGRLRHPKPRTGASARPWPLRECDFDVLDHVNNARYLEAVEDELAVRVPGHRVVQASVEYRGAVERGEALTLVSDQRELGEGAVELAAWLLVEGAVRVSAFVEVGDPTRERPRD
jgi:acyl-ACP thioesterase